MVKRKTPIHHRVKSHKREGKPVRSYERGSGSRARRSRRMVASNVQVRLKTILKGDCPIKWWGIDTEYAHGVKGSISIGLMDVGGPGRIGPDLDLQGDVEDLVNGITKPSGEVREYLTINDYVTKIDSIDVPGVDLTRDEKRYLILWAKSKGVDLEIY